MSTNTPNTGRRIEAAYTLGLSDARAGRTVNPYSVKRRNLRMSWQAGFDDAGVGEKHTVRPGMDLHDLCKPGDVVRVWLLPIHKYTLNGDQNESSPYMDGSDLPAILAGTFTATVESTHYVECGSSENDNGEGIALRDLSLAAYSKPDYNLELLSAQLTHIQVIKAAPAPEVATFGNMRLEWTRDRVLFCNGRAVTPALVAGVWSMRNRPLPAAAAGLDLTANWDNGIRLHPGGFVCGCASCTLEELDQALDWVAQKLSWA
jgi:hypothetical protein